MTKQREKNPDINSVDAQLKEILKLLQSILLELKKDKS